MASPEAASSVKRTALLEQEGEKYTLELLENGNPVDNFELLIIDSKDAKIHERLRWVNRRGREKGATHSMVTKGSSFVFEGNQYPVEEDTPFEPANVGGSGDAGLTRAREIDAGDEGPRKKRLLEIGTIFSTEDPSPQPGEPVVDMTLILPPWNRLAHHTTRVVPMVTRDVYEKLSQRLFDEVADAAVVMGMPGIGKSWFVDAFASFLIQKGCAVLLECD